MGPYFGHVPKLTLSGVRHHVLVGWNDVQRAHWLHHVLGNLCVQLICLWIVSLFTQCIHILDNSDSSVLCISNSKHNWKCHMKLLLLSHVWSLKKFQLLYLYFPMCMGIFCRVWHIFSIQGLPYVWIFWIF